jgi:hypothetical protein
MQALDGVDTCCPTVRRRILPAEARDYFTQGVQEQIAFGIIANNCLACIAAGGDVVNRTGKLDFQRASPD